MNTNHLAAGMWQMFLFLFLFFVFVSLLGIQAILNICIDNIFDFWKEYFTKYNYIVGQNLILFLQHLW